MKSKIDNKFSHSTWFKGQGLTKRQFIEYIAKHNNDFYIDEKPSLKQSDSLLDDLKMDKVVKGANGFYRLSEEEYKYYLSIAE